jgi:hypothetical protein
MDGKIRGLSFADYGYNSLLDYAYKFASEELL